jgi:PucR C-terminal helix-turn-helix domain/GGDEF-like domain
VADGFLGTTTQSHEHIAEVARRLATTVDVERAADGVCDEIMTAVWPEIEDSSFHAALDRCARANLRTLVDVLAGRIALRDAAPLAALEFAEVSAQLQVPETDLERAYRIATAGIWKRWFDCARAQSEATGDSLVDLLDGPMLTISDYADHVLLLVVARYEAVRADLRRTRRDTRRRTIRQILDGEIDTVTDTLERELDYALGDTHVALLLTTDSSRLPDQEIAALRSAANARGTLVLQYGPRTWLVWLGFRSGFGNAQRSRLRRALPTIGLTVVAGEAAAGLSGLRRTAEQALEAARIQRAVGQEGQPYLWAREVRLEALLLHDEQRARDFVAEELGPLASAEPQAARLRDTLKAWLATGSVVSAAAMLGVHENTVRNRIRAAEDMLGMPLLPRRTELQAALRLYAVLSGLERRRDDAGAAAVMH